MLKKKLETQTQNESSDNFIYDFAVFQGPLNAPCAYLEGVLDKMKRRSIDGKRNVHLAKILQVAVNSEIPYPVKFVQKAPKKDFRTQFSSSIFAEKIFPPKSTSESSESTTNDINDDFAYFFRSYASVWLFSRKSD